MLDLGTGSGCIAIALLANARGRRVSIDVSIEALEARRQTPRRHGGGGPARGCEESRFEPLAPDERFDPTVTDPPYTETATIAEAARRGARARPHPLRTMAAPDGLGAIAQSRGGARGRIRGLVVRSRWSTGLSTGWGGRAASRERAPGLGGKRQYKKGTSAGPRLRAVDARRRPHAARGSKGAWTTIPLRSRARPEKVGQRCQWCAGGARVTATSSSTLLHWLQPRVPRGGPRPQAMSQRLPPRAAEARTCRYAWPRLAVGEVTMSQYRAEGGAQAPGERVLRVRGSSRRGEQPQCRFARPPGA